MSALLPSVPGSFGFFVSGLIEAVGWLIFCHGGGATERDGDEIGSWGFGGGEGVCDGG